MGFLAVHESQVLPSLEVVVLELSQMREHLLELLMDCFAGTVAKRPRSKPSVLGSVWARLMAETQDVHLQGSGIAKAKPANGMSLQYAHPS